MSHPPTLSTGVEEDDCATTVVLTSYCHAEELEDDDEYEEILSNLHDMATKVGECRAVYIPRTSCDAHAFVWFARPDLAAAAQAVWDGLRVGGDKLQAKVLSVGSPTGKSSWSVEEWQEAISRSTAPPAAGAVTTPTSCRVVLENILTQDDFDDPEGLEESLEDIRALAGKYGSVVDLQVVNDSVVLSLTKETKMLPRRQPTTYKEPCWAA